MIKNRITKRKHKQVIKVARVKLVEACRNSFPSRANLTGPCRVIEISYIQRHWITLNCNSCTFGERIRGRNIVANRDEITKKTLSSREHRYRLLYKYYFHGSEFTYEMFNRSKRIRWGFIPRVDQIYSPKLNFFASFFRFSRFFVPVFENLRQNWQRYFFLRSDDVKL